MKGPLPVYFESVGTATNVLKDASARLPIFFPDHYHEYLRTINGMISQHADYNQWDTVVLIVSKGLSRQVIEEFMQHIPSHKGEILIDPTASTPEHSSFDSENALKSSKERMIMMNEDCEDALIILYGVDGFNRATGLTAIKRQLGTLGIILDLLFEEESLTLEDLDSMENILQRERLKKIKEQISKLSLAMSIAKSGEDRDYTPYILSAGIVMLYSTIANLSFDPNNAMLQHSLKMILHQVKSIPNAFMHLGFDVTPFLDPNSMVLFHPIETELDLERKMKNDFVQKTYLRKNLQGPSIEPE